jgi:predicted amidohydrolase YtcJ
VTEATLWVGGRVFTGRRYVEALLVEDGRVAAAGTLDATRRVAPTGAERQELGGALVVPGLVDAHLHLGELAREGPDLVSARSLDALLERIGVWSTEHPSGPIVGRGWSEEWLGLGRLPNAADLDRLSTDRPVVLYHASGHAAWLNRRALELEGLSARLSSFPAAMVPRGSDGAPVGLLLEDAVGPLARALEEATAPPLEAFARTVRGLASLGLTRVGTMSTGPREAEALRSLDRAGKLSLTVRAYPRLVRLGDFPERLLAHRSARLAFVGVKAFLDGAFGPRTAWLSEPYADASDRSGIALGDPTTLAEALRAAEARGFPPALHAIGDAAVDRAVRLLAEHGEKAGPPARIEHVALTPPGTLGRLDRVRPALVVQPGFVWSDRWLRDRLGPERVRWAYRFRTLLDLGHLVAGSSDAPYDPVDPWRGIRAAVDRRDPLGASANPLPSEALSPEEAVSLYTVRAAAALGDPSEGSLEPGSSGDLVVLGAPHLRGAMRAPGPPVRETWIGGRRAFAGPGPAETV